MFYASIPLYAMVTLENILDDFAFLSCSVEQCRYVSIYRAEKIDLFLRHMKKELVLFICWLNLTLSEGNERRTFKRGPSCVMKVSWIRTLPWDGFSPMVSASCFHRSFWQSRLEWSNWIMTLENIKKALQSYLNANGLKVGNKTALKAEHAFICGVQACLPDGAGLPCFVQVCALSGRSILE